MVPALQTATLTITPISEPITNFDIPRFSPEYADHNRTATDRTTTLIQMEVLTTSESSKVLYRIRLTRQSDGNGGSKYSR